MNFLAHIVLSGNNTEIAIGNLIADTILPKERSMLSADMQKGVKLHHVIDSFTDQHPAFKNSVQHLRLSLKKYAPVATDVFYDHFLACNFHRFFPHTSLSEFSKHFYIKLEARKNQLPPRGNLLATHLIKNNWFEMYATVEGTHQILSQMAQRTKFQSNLEKSSFDLRQNYNIFNNDFNILFSDLMAFVKTSNLYE